MTRQMTRQHNNMTPHKMEFSKGIMIFVSMLCAGTWIVAAASWLLWREFPAELVQYTSWFFGAIAAYMLKTGYENREKIKCGGVKNGIKNGGSP